ncbi:hypothetical protein L598_007000000020 [Mesorhizobium sp. J18]|nr:hypothetical protein L598_007000000020 [Mesorhizobium sp. J18]
MKSREIRSHLSGFGKSAQFEQSVAVFEIDIDVEHDAVRPVGQLSEADDFLALVLENAAHAHDRIVHADGRRYP